MATTKWRLVIIDDGLTGVGPVCPDQAKVGTLHHDSPDWPNPAPVIPGVIGESHVFFPNAVFSCCPGPRIECNGTGEAHKVRDALNDVEAWVVYR